MTDACADIKMFCEAHGLDVRNGTVESIFNADWQNHLARRIADVAPSHFVAEPYEGTQIELLPTPYLVICENDKVITIRRAKQNWVILSGAGFSSKQRMKRAHFEVRYQPLTIVTHRGFAHQEFTWSSYLGGFSSSNSKRLTIAFFGHLISSIASLAMPIGALLIIDKVLAHNGVGTLDTVIILVIAAEILRYFATVSVNILQGEIAEEFMEETRSLVFDITRNTFQHQSQPTSHSLHTILNHIEKTRKIFTNYSVKLLSECIFLLILIALMFALSSLLTGIALVGVVASILVTFIVGLLRNKTKTRQFDVSESNKKLFVQLLNSIGDRRLMGRDHYSARRWRENTDNIVQFDLASAEYKFDNAPINNFILNALRAAIMWFGAIEVLNGLMSLGQFVAFNLIVALALGPVKAMAAFMSDWNMLNKSALAVQTTLRRSQEQMQKRTFHLPHSDTFRAIKLREVALFGKKGAPPIASRINLTINKGEKIAIVGASGVGKSTLIDALSGVNNFYGGSITLNNVELSDYSLPAYRRRLGVLGQSAKLSEGTVLENLLLGETNIETWEITRALQQAHVNDDVTELDNGLEESIRHDTRKLSLGQIQRLLLARTLLHGQDLLLLDEPTSALDANAERAIGEQLTNADEQRTVIVVTHSLALAGLFEKVLKFENNTLIDVTQSLKTMTQKSAMPPIDNVSISIVKG